MTLLWFKIERFHILLSFLLPRFLLFVDDFFSLMNPPFFFLGMRKGKKNVIWQKIILFIDLKGKPNQSIARSINVKWDSSMKNILKHHRENYMLDTIVP